MYNLNVSLTPTPLLGVDGGGVCSTPRTPEILNSLIAMTNPLEYSYSANSQLSQPDSPSSCSASPLDSPAGNTTPSVQQMCSQLIKASLKQSIQSKRKISSGDSSCGETYGKYSKREGETTDDDSVGKSPRTGVRTLTPEDEDRRRRRRERNKIAATKCRMKKREKTLNLVSESETLENQNVTLKKEVTDLETQRLKLVQALEAHSSKCIHHTNFQSQQYQSPAYKFLPELGLCSNSKNNNNNNNNINNNNSNSNNNNQENGLKFCQIRKHQPPNSINFCKTALPPGYCKPSPTTDINYTLSPDSNDFNIKSTKELSSFHQNFKTDYIPNCENSNNDILCCGNDSGQDFINNLKTELHDSTSPYTTVQSADRFLFENSENFMDNDRITHTHTPLHIIKDNRNTPILEFNGNIQSFDTSIIKTDFLHQTTDFLDVNDTQFTDLDSGMTTYTSIQSNGGCLV